MSYCTLLSDTDSIGSSVLFLGGETSKGLFNDIAFAFNQVVMSTPSISVLNPSKVTLTVIVMSEEAIDGYTGRGYLRPILR